MNRLTDKELASCLKNGSYMTYNKELLRKNNSYSVEDYYCKLSEYEDIEELFVNMCKNGIYTRNGKYVAPSFQMMVLYDNGEFVVIFENDNDAFYLSEYGKIWALTIEELK